jgi:hypothetical protein
MRLRLNRSWHRDAEPVRQIEVAHDRIDQAGDRADALLRIVGTERGDEVTLGPDADHHAAVPAAQRGLVVLEHVLEHAAARRFCLSTVREASAIIDLTTELYFAQRLLAPATSSGASRIPVSAPSLSTAGCRQAVVRRERVIDVGVRRR